MVDVGTNRQRIPSHRGKSWVRVIVLECSHSRLTHAHALSNIALCQPVLLPLFNKGGKKSVMLIHELASK